MEMLLGWFLRCIQYERKCMHRKLEIMSNKKLMKFELFKTVFRKLLLEDNLDMNYFYFTTSVISTRH